MWFLWFAWFLIVVLVVQKDFQCVSYHSHGSLVFTQLVWFKCLYWFSSCGFHGSSLWVVWLTWFFFVVLVVHMVI